MKRIRSFDFGLCSALFVTALALPSLASGQNNANEGHAGYQGIPMKDSSTPRAIEQTDSSDTHRYPALPRRQNETDLNAASADNQSNNEDRGGYRGIPRSNTSDHGDVQRNENPNPQGAEPSGYSGIPRAANAGETRLVAQRDPR